MEIASGKRRLCARAGRAARPWLAVGLFLALSGTTRGNAGNLFVTPHGTGTACTQAQPCGLHIALDQARAGDIVNVAGGTYTGRGDTVVTVTHSVELRGGWDGAASGRVVYDPERFPTILDGEGERRVVTITGEISPLLTGFTITRGNAAGQTANCHARGGGDPEGCGGGIFIYQASAVIADNVITDNVATTSAGQPSPRTGYGGGVYVGQSDGAVITGNIVSDNIGSLAANGGGGGVFLDQCGAGTEVHGNQIVSNTATTADTAGWGGGINLHSSDSLLQDNLLEGNTASTTGWAQGSALFAWYGAPTIVDNLVTGNSRGEAVYLGRGEALFARNRVLQNDTSTAVYLMYGFGDGVVLVNNLIAGSDTHSLYAGGSSSDPLAATVLHNTIVGQGMQHGVYLGQYASLTMVNNIVTSHRTGITNSAPGNSTVLADHTLFWANSSDGLRGTNPVDGDPAFVEPAVGDYHITSLSAAFDAGSDVGVTDDFDGDSRPQGRGFDIGADELGLPLTETPTPTRTAAATATGTPTPTATRVPLESPVPRLYLPLVLDSLAP